MSPSNPLRPPPPARGRCGFTGATGQCQNPGRWDRDGVLSCTTHKNARDPRPFDSNRQRGDSGVGSGVINHSVLRQASSGTLTSPSPTVSPLRDTQKPVLNYDPQLRQLRRIPADAPRTIAELPWVQALKPIRQPYLSQLSQHSDLVVWHVDVAFSFWPTPPRLQDRWKVKKTWVDETWQKQPLVVGVDSGCEYSCGEVEMAARLRRAGLQAYWVSEWNGFPHVACWQPFCIKRSELAARASGVHVHDERLRQAAYDMGIALGRRGGHPDVVAWSEDSAGMVFMEYKGPNDTMKPKQNGWAEALIASESSRVPYVAVRGVIR